MAKTTHVVTTDDLDGSEDAETYSFALNGTEYSIDLSTENFSKLESALSPFIEAGSKVGGTRRRAATGGKRSDLQDVRAWARSNGYEVSERGRIPQAVMEAYDAR